jgi:prophage maintenance system killer protein
MRHLTLGEVVELHQRLFTQTGGASGIRDLAVDEQEQLMLGVASGSVDRAELARWLSEHTRPTA